MKCILVFNHLNDIVYTKYNRKFVKHINKFAEEQGLYENELQNGNNKLATNIIMQIFSPIITSQRIMTSQFGNSYTSCQCQDGINVVFDQYMGYIFLNISEDETSNMKKLLSICISFVRYLCGADVSILQSNKNISGTLTRLLDNWILVQENDQAFLVEAVEQLMVNSDLSSATLSALQEAIEKIKNQTDYSKAHALVFVQNKFLSLFSSRNAQDLSATDIMFINLLCMTTKSEIKSLEVETDSDNSEEFYSPASSPQQSPKFTKKSKVLSSYQILLMGNESTPKCLPHIVHISSLTDDVNLVLLFELGNPLVSSGIYESFLYLTTIQNMQIQLETETFRHIFENLDIAVKKVNDGLKKFKNPPIETSQKKLITKWDFIKKKYQEFIKTNDSECLLRIESSTLPLLDVLKEILLLTSFDSNCFNSSLNTVDEIIKLVNDKLANFHDFLKVKALRNLSLGSTRTSLTINKYLEEFPGLVHFLYIDRTNHRITAPSLDFNSEETITLTKKKIWNMVKFCRMHLNQGHLSVMWKDTTFNYAYFLWFEDKAGSPLKPKVFPVNSLKPLPQSGILCGDFYQKLIEVCFPKMIPNKVRCYELYCIHLGLVTSSCVLEHTRRLAATIWEIIGVPNNPIDLM